MADNLIFSWHHKDCSGISTKLIATAAPTVGWHVCLSSDRICADPPFDFAFQSHLPGFYYDAEKNRYFPYKGPIPGSSLKPLSIPSPSHPKQADGLCQSIKVRQQQLLQARELFGDVISSRKRKLSFQAEYEKKHASQPLIWKYIGTKKMANIALEHVVADITSPHGLVERDILLSGGVNGLLCLFQVGKTRQEVDPMQSYKVSRKSPLPANDAMPNYFLITTLGSDSAPGSVYLVDFSKPLDFDASVPIARDRFHEEQIEELCCSIWKPEYRHGCFILKVMCWLCSLISLHKNLSKLKWKGVKVAESGDIVQLWKASMFVNLIRSGHSSSAVSMPSSICCLASLKLWDRYFLASSMDGSIKLYDHRLTPGPVQSYEGNVNSHTRIELGIDPSEKVVMSVNMIMTT
ncbi:UNVERIFIED_CONTAM: hypothetical protein Scaly_1333300 [Sesamum calycinum]|uniref:Transducin/WD40 repeat-like superfamily protein n=1 Tax=Sesamum calycinum TaxID=2727403 RepID=A0AAW2Q861_9LAMI